MALETEKRRPGLRQYYRCPNAAPKPLYCCGVDKEWTGRRYKIQGVGREERKRSEVSNGEKRESAMQAWARKHEGAGYMRVTTC